MKITGFLVEAVRVDGQRVRLLNKKALVNVFEARWNDGVGVSLGVCFFGVNICSSSQNKYDNAKQQDNLSTVKDNVGFTEWCFIKYEIL